MEEEESRREWERKCVCVRERKKTETVSKREREKGRKERVNENESKSVIEEKNQYFLLLNNYNKVSLKIWRSKVFRQKTKTRLFFLFLPFKIWACFLTLAKAFPTWEGLIFYVIQTSSAFVFGCPKLPLWQKVWGQDFWSVWARFRCLVSIFLRLRRTTGLEPKLTHLSRNFLLLCRFVLQDVLAKFQSYLHLKYLYSNHYWCDYRYDHKDWTVLLVQKLTNKRTILCLKNHFEQSSFSSFFPSQ